MTIRFPIIDLVGIKLGRLGSNVHLNGSKVHLNGSGRVDGSPVGSTVVEGQLRSVRVGSMVGSGRVELDFFSGRLRSRSVKFKLT